MNKSQKLPFYEAIAKIRKRGPVLQKTTETFVLEIGSRQWAYNKLCEGYFITDEFMRQNPNVDPKYLKLKNGAIVDQAGKDCGYSLESANGYQIYIRGAK